ncbi:MAG: HipA domain-containing protein [Propionibacteriaceae bacterium]|jgi:serine/threonine-protein kinase HipA|nr:HipA domain-containing protein [Propionibacteriaceae bacterium]
MRPNILNLWLHGEHLGEVEHLRNGSNRLRFTADSVKRWGNGTYLLSYSLPLTSRRIESPALEAYLDNLLPEGALRTQLEQKYRIRPGDVFGLLTHLGSECAGAVQLTPEDVPPTGHLVDLSDSEVNQIVGDLPTLAPPAGQTVTASLGGVQSKVLLTRTDRGWAWPAAGAMSTHLVKPEPADPHAPIPRLIEYEHWTMHLAAQCGIPTARTDLTRFGDRLALVVERYDRADGRRLHQEDFAQALGIRPGLKYEPGGPAAAQQASRLKRIAMGPGAETDDPRAFRTSLLRLVTFNLLIGNGDAHAKNYSLLLQDGTFSLAPAYDLTPVYHINNQYDDFGLSVGGQRHLRYLAARHLIAEAQSWGMSELAARDTIAHMAEALVVALDVVPVTPLVEPLAQAIARRTTAFG